MLKNKKILLSCIMLLLCFLGAYIWYFPTNRLETVEIEEQVIVPDLIEEVTVSELVLPEQLPELKVSPLPLVNGLQNKQQEVTGNTIRGSVTLTQLNPVKSELKPLQALPGLNSSSTHPGEVRASIQKKKKIPATKVLAAFEAETGISSKTIQKAMSPE